MIELLKEERAAIINQAVTKGINPDAEMKDSGIEWLGEVPKHWDVISIKNLIRTERIEIQDGNHGELHPLSSDYVEIGIPFIMANDINEGKINLTDAKKIPLELAESLRIGFSITGDVLLTHKGTIGRVAVVPEIKSRYIILTPQVTYYRINNKETLNNFWFYYFFQSVSFLNQIEQVAGQGSTRSYIGLIAQKELKIALPPLREQKLINDYLQSVLIKTDSAINHCEKEITLIEEYRTALINEAVTGKIKVTESV